jgi:hypothetical protein
MVLWQNPEVIVMKVKFTTNEQRIYDKGSAQIKEILRNHRHLILLKYQGYSGEVYIKHPWQNHGLQCLEEKILENLVYLY